jgi:hypothetical protein
VQTSRLAGLLPFAMLVKKEITWWEPIMKAADPKRS